MRKEVWFVCVITLSTFLIVTADRDYENENYGSSNNEVHEFSNTKLPIKSTKLLNYDKNENNESDNDDEVHKFTTTVLPRQSEKLLKSDKNERNLMCASPPNIEGSIPPRVDGTEHAVGTNVTYRCNYGYVSRNAVVHISTCVVDKTTGQANWTVPEIACNPRSCGDPGYVNNGRRIGNLFTFPNKVEFECDEGYKMNGINERYCQSLGEWSGILPTCDLIYCSVPPDPVNGRVRYSSLKYGTELRYECNTGFKLQEHEPRFCTEDGTWSDVEPDCIEIRCENPNPPENGNVQLFGDPKVGSIATFSCNLGKKLIGASTTKCLMSGRWTFDSPKCFSFCSIPNIDNGEMGQLYRRHVSGRRYQNEFQKFGVGNEVEHNETLYLRCFKDFLPAEGDEIYEVGYVDVACNDGIWSKDLHCKRRIKCEKPIHPQHGSVKVTGPLIVGSIATFSCNFGKKLYGVSIAKCLRTGQWNVDSPKCFGSCRVPYIQDGELRKQTVSQWGEKRFTKFNHRDQVDHDETSFLICNKDFVPAEGDTKFDDNRVEVICNDGIWSKILKCRQRFCSVPYIENGEMMRRQKSNQRGEQGFTKLKYGDQVDPNETFFLTCNEGFVTAEGDTIFEYNLVEVTCHDGTWSKILKCIETSCLGEPPKMKNAVAVITKRSHKHEIWYTCNNEAAFKVLGNVTCHFGVWIGNTPKCLNSPPCYTKDLNYTGMVEPSQELLENSETLNIVCKQGFRLSTSARSITCSEGKWNITQNPCLKAHNDYQPNKTISEETTSTRPPTIEGSQSFSHIATSQPAEECDCIYEGSSNFVVAKVGDTYLRDGDRVKKGETVSFECDNLRILSWRNSLRIYVKVYVTCTTCQIWRRSDNPTCIEAKSGSPFIVLDNAIHLLPGGAAEINVGKSAEIMCASTFSFPVWYLRGIYVAGQDRNHELSGSTRIHYKRIYISRTDHYNQGIYECRVPGFSPMEDPSTVLDLRVKGNPCPSLETDLLVSYTNGNEVGSLATFRCPQGSTLVGDFHARCQNDGTWSSAQPHCKDNTCPSLETDLLVSYTNGNEVGSGATFRCPQGSTLVGDSQARCQNDGTWSSPQPHCKDNTCPSLETDLLVSYTNGNEVGSKATFKCPQGSTLVGDSQSRCQRDGTWSSPQPYCRDRPTCSIFPSAIGLETRYSDGIYVGSNVSFKCLPEKILIGNSYAICQDDGVWSHPLPMCEDRCSIDDLAMSLTENVVPDLTGGVEEYVPFGSTVQLMCENKHIPDGNSTVLCGKRGRWKIGNFQCLSGCRLNINLTSHLIVQPLKEVYRFGEHVLLSCPDGEERTSEVERLVCMGSFKWSDPIPDCKPT